MGAAQEASAVVVSKEEQGGGGSREGKQTQRPEDDLQPTFKRGVLNFQRKMKSYTGGNHRKMWLTSQSISSSMFEI